MINKAKKYLFIIILSIRSYGVYTTELILRSGFFVLILYIFINLWKYTYGSKDQSNIIGLSLNQVLWYLVVTESIVISRTRLERTIEDEIRSGNVCYSIIKPYSYILLHICNGFGERIIRFLINLFIGCFLMLILSIKITIHINSIIYILIAIVLAIIIDMSFSILFGLFAFWIENSSPLYFVFTRAQMILGGLLVPITVFPETLKKIAMVLPFRYIVYEPAMIFVNYSFESFLNVVKIQLIYVILVGVVLKVIYLTGRSKLNINGG